MGRNNWVGPLMIRMNLSGRKKKEIFIEENAEKVQKRHQFTHILQFRSYEV